MEPADTALTTAILNHARALNDSGSYRNRIGMESTLNWKIDPAEAGAAPTLKIRKWLSWKEDFYRHVVYFRQDLEACGISLDRVEEEQRLFKKEDPYLSFQIQCAPERVDEAIRLLEAKSAERNAVMSDNRYREILQSVRSKLPQNPNAEIASRIVTELQGLVDKTAKEWGVTPGTILQGPLAEHQRLLNKQVESAKETGANSR